MTCCDPPPRSYADFQSFLTAYRKSCALMTAHELGIFKILAKGPKNAGKLCLETGMDISYGTRFLDTLHHLGLLDKQEDMVELSPFSRRFLCEKSEEYQGRSLDFEKRLIESWQQLLATLCRGKRVYGTGKKSPDEYKKALAAYLGAMDDAARIRARELWDRIKPGDYGVILDAGAGSGAFLIEFMGRHPRWKGVFCDLPDVVNRAVSNPVFSPFMDRMDFKAVNFLDDTTCLDVVRADIILCSNLVHCQGFEETEGLLSRLVEALSRQGVLIIHDFLKNHGTRGALYDLHMMLNTYNGRTYTTDELRTMVNLEFHHVLTLPSGSCALFFSNRDSMSEFFV